ncbi:MAG: FKBP-type peptidyl-prolyl cis-trans isomerase [Chitinophagaceae bacterium]|nr:FKBP-type peptidyl-prolyl cis-trans isomerase [Chitinophagaceae bacterium]
MLRNLLIIMAISVFATSCLKNDSSQQCPYAPLNTAVPQAEQNALATFIDTNHIPATRHPKGFYYNIVTPGSGTDSLGMCSNVLIDYKGSLTNGSEFDSGENKAFAYALLIEGMQNGLSLIRSGGEIHLFVPPSLGYGVTPVKNKDSVVVIPPNSILAFDVKLKSYTATY